MRATLRRFGALASTGCAAIATGSIAAAGPPAAAPGAGEIANTAVSSGDRKPVANSTYQNRFSCIPSGGAPHAVGKLAQPPTEAPAHAPKSYQIISAGKNVASSPEMANDQPSGTSKADDCGDAMPRAKSKATAPDAITGETKTIGAGMVTPAVQSGRSYVPPKPKPKPDSE